MVAGQGGGLCLETTLSLPWNAPTTLRPSLGCQGSLGRVAPPELWLGQAGSLAIVAQGFPRAEVVADCARRKGSSKTAPSR